MSANKLIVALFGALITIASHFGVDAEPLRDIAVPGSALITAALVYIVPNFPVVSNDMIGKIDDVRDKMIAVLKLFPEPANEIPPEAGGERRA